MKGIRELVIMVAENVRFRFCFEGCRCLKDLDEPIPNLAKVGGGLYWVVDNMTPLHFGKTWAEFMQVLQSLTLKTKANSTLRLNGV